MTTFRLISLYRIERQLRFAAQIKTSWYETAYEDICRNYVEQEQGVGRPAGQDIIVRDGFG